MGSRRDFELLNRVIEVNGLRFGDIIAQKFTFEKAGEAMDYLWSGKHVGKVIVEIP